MNLKFAIIYGMGELKYVRNRFLGILMKILKGCFGLGIAKKYFFLTLKLLII